jgi:hypothetical protein
MDPVFGPAFGPWSLVVIEKEHGAMRQTYPEKGYCNSSDGKEYCNISDALEEINRVLPQKTKYC